MIFEGTVKRFRDFSILYKLIIINSLFMLFLVGSLTAIFLNHARVQFTEDLKQDGHLLVNSLARNSVLPVLSRNYDLVAGFLEGVLNYPDVVYAAVYGKDGKLLAERAKERFDDYVEFDPLLARKEGGALKIYPYGAYSLMTVFAPVAVKRVGSGREELGLSEDIFAEMEGNEEVVGYVSLGLSTENIVKRFVSVSTRWIAIAVTLYLIGISLVVFVLRRFVQPIKVLSDGARKVAEGDLSPRIIVNSGDEVGALASSFNHMVDNLKSYIARIRENAQEIENLAEGAMDAIFLVDEDCTLVRVNREMERLLGYDRQEMVGKNIEKFIALDKEECKNLLKMGKVTMKEVDFMTSDGRLLPFEVNLTVVKYGKKKGILGFARDVSERKKMERQLIQAEKLAATGRLAADIAHEVNNPLGIIKNYLTILKRESVFTKKDVVESIDIIDEEINRIAEIIKGLLAFSRSEPGERVSCNINDTIKQILHLTHNALEAHGIKVEMDLDESIREVQASPGHVKQVFINLINNAQDALPEGGFLQVKTYDLEESGVVIEVVDSGVGLDEDSVNEVFSPFYTTKGVKGTGLGLSISYGIVKGYNGKISLENRKEGGVRAKVFLPYRKEVPGNG